MYETSWYEIDRTSNASEERCCQKLLRKLTGASRQAYAKPPSGFVERHVATEKRLDAAFCRTDTGFYLLIGSESFAIEADPP